MIRAGLLVVLGVVVLVVAGHAVARALVSWRSERRRVRSVRAAQREADLREQAARREARERAKDAIEDAAYRGEPADDFTVRTTWDGPHGLGSIFLVHEDVREQARAALASAREATAEEIQAQRESFTLPSGAGWSFEFSGGSCGVSSAVDARNALGAPADDDPATWTILRSNCGHEKATAAKSVDAPADAMIYARLDDGTGLRYVPEDDAWEPVAGPGDRLWTPADDGVVVEERQDFDHVSGTKTVTTVRRYAGISGLSGSVAVGKPVPVRPHPLGWTVVALPGALCAARLFSSGDLSDGWAVDRYDSEACAWQIVPYGDPLHAQAVAALGG